MLSRFVRPLFSRPSVTFAVRGVARASAVELPRQSLLSGSMGRRFWSQTPQRRSSLVPPPVHENDLKSEAQVTAETPEISEQEKRRRERRAKEPKMMAVFTCNKCETREKYVFAKASYEKGVVIVRCPGCESLHLIADNLGWFRNEPTNIEDLARENGEVASRMDPTIVDSIVQMYKAQHHQHSEHCEHHHEHEHDHNCQHEREHDHNCQHDHEHDHNCQHDHEHVHTEACQHHHEHQHDHTCQHDHHHEHEMEEGDKEVLSLDDLVDEDGAIRIRDSVGNDVDIYQDDHTLEFSLENAKKPTPSS